ncbi:polyribonucleotide nucleotidyltransferase [Candidatus Parcubacteria bacterium]|jgi:polyribonucleotide nucleotidyltransferase|nr:MAG: polyribonucleotide nucleotidyltransferase [Candidatus Parcubacteria bacterium]
MSEIKTFSASIGGKTLIIETGKYAGLANAACTVRYGDTLVLATVVLSNTIREGIDFFPLMVEYEERLYAAGKIKGSRFIKREGRPTDEAVLTGRMIDRSIRPLFDDRLRNDVQVSILVLSVDQENDPDIPALIGAATVLSMSEIPWNGPIAGIRIGQINGEWVLNPSYEAREKSDLDLILASSSDKAVMIEAGAKQVTEETILEGIKFGQKHIKKIIDLIEEVVKATGKEKINPLAGTEAEEEREKVKAKVEAFLTQEKRNRIFASPAKQDQKAAIESLTKELDEQLKADNEVSKDMRVAGVGMLGEMIDQAALNYVLETGKRVDGRAYDEIRPLSAEVGLLPRTHGSGLFQRGETQVLSTVTLGSPGDEQTLDGMEESGKKRYMHHYNFPPYSVGEAKPNRGPGRREIGHGALAERALEPVLPPKEQFPYTIRVVSEVLASNGSTSQASACGSTLALMDAGVPIIEPVAGIAMGLIVDPNKPENYKVITDIQGIEDHSGGMDFKVAGTKNGVTAMQVDIKVDGLGLAVVEEALVGAKKARQQILDVITQAIPEPRKELSPYAPRITTLQINPELIREVIGKGGETINKIIDECGGADVIKVDIEESGLIFITSTSAEMATKAEDWIKNITREIVPGEIIEGTVLQIQKDRNSGAEIGAIVELAPGKDGMVHISEFSQNRIRNVSDIVSVGQKLKVKVMEVDKERGRIGLSVKALGTDSDLAIPDSAIDNSPRRENGFHGGNRRFSGPPRGRGGRERF